MRRPTRVQVYPGLYRSQADERFEADAVEAAKHGWRPLEGRWNGEELAVTYVKDGLPWRRSAAPRARFEVKDTQKQPSMKRGRSRLRKWVAAAVNTVVFLALLAAVIVSIFAVALIADVGNIREMSEDLPKPIPKLVRDFLDWVKDMRAG
jgi:hypothetical protein